MSDETSTLAESKGAEAAQAAAVAAEAGVSALKAQFGDLLAESDARTGKMISEAIREAFSENKAQGRYIDVTRIPLICQNIDGIHEYQREMVETVKGLDKKLDEKFVTKERFGPIEKIVYGAVGAILLAVLGALLSFVVVKKTAAATLKPESKSSVELLARNYSSLWN